MKEVTVSAVTDWMQQAVLQANRTTAYLQKSGNRITFQLENNNQGKNVIETAGILIPLLRKYVLRNNEIVARLCVTVSLKQSI